MSTGIGRTAQARAGIFQNILRVLAEPHEELALLFAYLDRADAEGLEHPFLTLGIRLHFQFAARMSEIVNLEWSWVDIAGRRVSWPDSKTGRMSKPLSAQAVQLLVNAPRIEGSPYVCPSIFDPSKPMTQNTYSSGWKRVLKRAGVPHVGTHGIRHRAATDIANSGVAMKVGMALTAHKTVTMFMRYVHNEDDPIRAAAETVAQRRQTLIEAVTPQISSPGSKAAGPSPTPLANLSEVTISKPSILDDGQYTSRAKLGNIISHFDIALAKTVRFRRAPSVPPERGRLSILGAPKVAEFRSRPARRLLSEGPAVPSAGRSRVRGLRLSP